jgi:hypothetical protein
MSEQVTTADILDHLRKLYDGQALMNETLADIRERLIALEKDRLESIQDAEFVVAVAESLGELMEEVGELKSAVSELEQNGTSPRILN